MLKVHVCKCNQCKLTKKNISTKCRKFFKRLTNKKIRKASKNFNEHKTFNFYWA